MLQSKKIESLNVYKNKTSIYTAYKSITLDPKSPGEKALMFMQQGHQGELMNYYLMSSVQYLIFITKSTPS